MWIEPGDARVSVAEQCQLVGLPRSTYYHVGVGESDENLALMRVIDEQYLQTPFFGSRGMTQWLLRQGYEVNRKRVRRLMRLMDLEAIYPRRRTSDPCQEHRISWELSNTLDSRFCVSALQAALVERQPEIFNTDQGAQFTSQAFTGVLEQSDIAISMDGRGRALDNVFIERLWRTVKYENIYLHGYQTALGAGIPDAVGGVLRRSAAATEKQINFRREKNPDGVRTLKVDLSHTRYVVVALRPRETWEGSHGPSGPHLN